MKIGYLDLNYTSFYEDYSLAPRRYGGGRVFASWCKEFFDFEIYGAPEVFDGVRDTENKNHTIPLTARQMWMLNHGHPLADIAPEFHLVDLFVYPHTNTYLNLDGLKAKQCVWSVGYEEPIHIQHEHLLLYNQFQSPKILNPNTKIHNFTLGIELPPFKVRRKEDFIFQCSRHVDVFSSIEVAEFCKRYNIRGYFAGPIAQDYDLLSHIDNKTTFYLGEISEEVKRDYLSRARLYTSLHNWPTPFSLSAIEALSHGTPIACSPVGFWGSLIEQEVNGFFCSDEHALLTAYKNAHLINQRNCYSSALPHNHFAMTNSVMECFERILCS